jgi:glycosyltransferase involved in cell wall biosynthesis
MPLDPVFSAEPDPVYDAETTRVLGQPERERPEILHVGSVVPRKRIEWLLRVFAAVRERSPRAILVRAGGALTPGQRQLVRELRLEGTVKELPYLTRPLLAAVYRRAAAVLFPSEREGFGLPVAEAMACGSSVIASDLPVLRETGGDAAIYCQLTDLAEWVDRVTRVVSEWSETGKNWDDRRNAGLKQAAKFTAFEHASRMARIYREVLRSSGG